MFLRIHCSRIPKPLHLLPLFLAVLQLSGLHWVGLQGLAWSGMLITYTVGTRDLPEAVQSTFNGSAPCALCQAIETGRETELGSNRQREGAPAAPGDSSRRVLPLESAMPGHAALCLSRPVSWSCLALCSAPGLPAAGSYAPDPPPPRSA